MEPNTALKISHDFNGYLVCQIPPNTVEVELKIKTTRGNYTLNKDAYSRTERYHSWDRADRGAKIHTKRRKTNRKEMVSIGNVDTTTTNSETDIQDGEGFAYAPQIFTNPNYAMTTPLTDSENSEVEVTNKHFIGEYCGECVKKHDRCWCSKSNRDEELMGIETTKGHTNSLNTNLFKSMNVTVMPVRQPPPGWIEFRKHMIKQMKINECEDLREENPIEKLIIKGIRSITTKEFEEM